MFSPLSLETWRRGNISLIIYLVAFTIYTGGSFNISPPPPSSFHLQKTLKLININQLCSDSFNQTESNTFLAYWELVKGGIGYRVYRPPLSEKDVSPVGAWRPFQFDMNELKREWCWGQRRGPRWFYNCITLQIFSSVRADVWRERREPLQSMVEVETFNCHYSLTTSTTPTITITIIDNIYMLRQSRPCSSLYDSFLFLIFEWDCL